MRRGFFNNNVKDKKITSITEVTLRPNTKSLSNNKLNLSQNDEDSPPALLTDSDDDDNPLSSINRVNPLSQKTNFKSKNNTSPNTNTESCINNDGPPGLLTDSSDEDDIEHKSTNLTKSRYFSSDESYSLEGDSEGDSDNYEDDYSDDDKDTYQSSATAFPGFKKGFLNSSTKVDDTDDMPGLEVSDDDDDNNQPPDLISLSASDDDDNENYEEELWNVQSQGGPLPTKQSKMPPQPESKAKPDIKEFLEKRRKKKKTCVPQISKKEKEMRELEKIAKLQPVAPKPVPVEEIVEEKKLLSSCTALKCLTESRDIWDNDEYVILYCSDLCTNYLHLSCYKVYKRTNEEDNTLPCPSQGCNGYIKRGDMRRKDKKIRNIKFTAPNINDKRTIITSYDKTSKKKKTKKRDKDAITKETGAKVSQRPKLRLQDTEKTIKQSTIKIKPQPEMTTQEIVFVRNSDRDADSILKEIRRKKEDTIYSTDIHINSDCHVGIVVNIKNNFGTIMNATNENHFFHFDSIIGKIKAVQLYDLVQYRDGPQKESRVKVNVQVLDRPVHAPKELTEEIKEQIRSELRSLTRQDVKLETNKKGKSKIIDQTYDDDHNDGVYANGEFNDILDDSITSNKIYDDEFYD